MFLYCVCVEEWSGYWDGGSLAICLWVLPLSLRTTWHFTQKSPHPWASGWLVRDGIFFQRVNTHTLIHFYSWKVELTVFIMILAGVYFCLKKAFIFSSLAARIVISSTVLFLFFKPCIRHKSDAGLSIIFWVCWLKQHHKVIKIKKKKKKKTSAILL